jgi:hypothetical protein
MQSKRRLGQWLKRSCLLFAVCAAFQARAEAEDIHFVSAANQNNTANITFNGTTEDVYASPLIFTSAPPATTPANFTAFCVDIPHNITNGETYGVTVATPVNGQVTLNGNAPLSVTATKEIAYFAAYGLGGLGTVTPDQAETAQLAIWQVLGATFPGLSVFYKNAIAALDTSALSAPSQLSNVVWLDSGKGVSPAVGQSMIYFSANAPEPASAVIMGLFAVPFCVGGIRRRFGRSRQA